MYQTIAILSIFFVKLPILVHMFSYIIIIFGYGGIYKCTNSGIGIATRGGARKIGAPFSSPNLSDLRYGACLQTLEGSCFAH